MADDLPRIRFETRAELETWMHEHQESQPGVWLVIAKKGAPFASITREDLVEVGLMYGWIDGLAHGIDEHSYAQRFTPRRFRSVWSMRNVKIVERLTAEGRIQPRGLTEIAAAQADGRWDRAYEGPATMVPHPDFLEALAPHLEAVEYFDQLRSGDRFTIYLQINNAAKPETRARRIAKYVQQLRDGQRPT